MGRRGSSANPGQDQRWLLRRFPVVLEHCGVLPVRAGVSRLVGRRGGAGFVSVDVCAQLLSLSQPRSRADPRSTRSATAPATAPLQNRTGRMRPTSAPASVRLESTANAAGATTTANRIAAPSHRAITATMVGDVSSDDVDRAPISGARERRARSGRGSSPAPPRSSSWARGPEAPSFREGGS